MSLEYTLVTQIELFNFYGTKVVILILKYGKIQV